jgi:uncharacterized protein with HEPN domain
MTAPRDDGVLLSHIGDAVQRISSYLDGVSETQFLNSPLIQDGVIRQIQIIGEAARKLSPSFIERSYAIPWKDTASPWPSIARASINHSPVGWSRDAESRVGDQSRQWTACP